MEPARCVQQEWSRQKLTGHNRRQKLKGGTQGQARGQRETHQFAGRFSHALRDHAPLGVGKNRIRQLCERSPIAQFK